MMYSVDSPLPPENSYKNGKISQGMRGFGRGFGITLLTPGSATAANYPQRKFGTDEKLLVGQMTIQKDRISFVLYSQPDANNFRYYGELTFPFAKGSTPSPDEAVKTINEVFLAQSPEQKQTADEGSQPTLVGQYFLHQTGATLSLNPDGSFILSAPNRPSSEGQYALTENTLILTYNATGRSANFRIQGDQLITDAGLAWVRQGGSGATTLAQAAADSDSAPPPPSPPPPPPPPPADAQAPPPPSISLGDAKDKVMAALGRPEKVIHLGEKEIDHYKELKVTFVNGKVTDVQ